MRPPSAVSPSSIIAPGLAVLAEAEILVVHDLGGREAVVQLDQVDVVRAEAGHLVGRLGRQARARR